MADEWEEGNPIGILVVPNHREDSERQHKFYQFQQGFYHGSRNGVDYPEQLHKMPPLKRPVDSYVYGFRQGRRYIKRSATTTKPMEYDTSVWRGFCRWERNYQEG